MNTAPSRGKSHHKKTGYFRKSTSNSIFATFNVNFEACRKYIVVLINKRLVKFQFDTTSDITLISHSTWELLGMPTLNDTTHVACSASGNKIQLTGELICEVSFEEKKFSGVCYIMDSSNLNLLGLDFIEELDLFKVPLNSIFNTCQVNSAADTDKHFMSILKAKFNNVFQEGLRCCTKVKATLKLKSDSKPIFRLKHPVPYTATVENELNHLQQEGVIQPINYSSWATPIVMVKKANGKVRLCADLSTGLNDASVSATCTGIICSQNSTVELVLQSCTLQMLIY